MKHLSEILKIIEHGINGDQEGVKNYANLLAEKLANEGLNKESKMIHKRANSLDCGPMAIPVSK